MRVGPQIAMLPDGRRLHLQHGPIDLIVEAFGVPEAVRAAYAAAARRFATILDELCGELSLLRSPVRPGSSRPEGVVAARMYDGVSPFAAETFITPMAAVAGAVAEEVLGAMVAAARLDRIYVNNGGDIALHLAEGESFRIGLFDRPDGPGFFGTTTLSGSDGIAGVATSGWRGRSFSFGIADAVTVLAATAAQADAAASIVANAVDLPGHPGVERVPACELQPDSDLGSLPVTRSVGLLAADEIAAALDEGVGCADRLIRRGLIRAAALHCAGETRIVGLPGASPHDHQRWVPSGGRPLRELRFAHA
jgi:ApbE superfamily uncharacterized protein (UPF0280 family)